MIYSVMSLSFDLIVAVLGEFEDAGLHPDILDRLLYRKDGDESGSFSSQRFTPSFPRKREPRASLQHETLDSRFRGNDGQGKTERPWETSTYYSIRTAKLGWPGIRI